MANIAEYRDSRRRPVDVAGFEYGGIEQGLTGMCVLAVTGIDDGCTGAAQLPRQLFGGTIVGVAQHDRGNTHCGQRAGRVDQALALARRGAGVLDIDDLQPDPACGQLE